MRGLKICLVRQLAGFCIDQAHLVAYSEGVSIDVKFYADILTCMASGEPPIIARVTAMGPGAKVWLESMPIEKLRNVLHPGGQRKGGGGGGEV